MIDRIEVMRKVLEGKLPPEAVTNEEIDEVQTVLMALIMEKKMSNGKIVFSEVENGCLN